MDQPPANPGVIVTDNDEPLQPIFEANSMDVKFYDPITKKSTLLINRMRKHMLPREIDIYEREFRKRGCDPNLYMSDDRKVATTNKVGESDAKEQKLAERLDVDEVDDKEWLSRQTNSLRKEVMEIRHEEKKENKKTRRRMKEHTISSAFSKKGHDNHGKRLEELKRIKWLSELGLGVPEFSRCTTDKLKCNRQDDPAEQKWIEAVNAAREDAFKFPYMWYAPECFFQESGPKTVPQFVEPIPGKVALFNKIRLDKQKSYAKLDKLTKDEMSRLYSRLRNHSKRQMYRGLIKLKNMQQKDMVVGNEESEDDQH